MFSGLRLKADGKAFKRTRPALDQIQKGDDGDETLAEKNFARGLQWRLKSLRQQKQRSTTLLPYRFQGLRPWECSMLHP
jgi:hypothetical protein